jgi:hypothetical protein
MGSAAVINQTSAIVGREHHRMACRFARIVSEAYMFIRNMFVVGVILVAITNGKTQGAVYDPTRLDLSTKK